MEACEAAPPGDSSVACDVGEGEVIFIPNEWTHATCNPSGFSVGIGGRCVWGMCLPGNRINGGGNAGQSAWSELYGPILMAALHGDVTQLRKFGEGGQEMAIGPDGGAAWGGDGVGLPLHYACKSGSLASVTYLVEQAGLSVTAHDNTGKAALHWATLGSHLDVMAYLIRKGANVRITNASAVRF